MSSDKNKEKTAVIAGAGPAGLTAAYELLKRTSVQPIVFESSDAIGGLSQTIDYKGNKMDLGGHRFFTKSRRVEDWWFSILPLEKTAPQDDEVQQEVWGSIDDAAREIEVLFPSSEARKSNVNGNNSHRIKIPAPDPQEADEVMLSRNRLSRIFFNNVFFPYPLTISPSVIRRLGILQSGLFFLSYLKAHVFPKKNEEYLDSFFINRFGFRLYSLFFRDYTEKVWGVPCSAIRADWGAQRIKGLSLRVAVKHALLDIFSRRFRESNKDRETSLINHFYYPKYGPGQMWEIVADRIQAANGSIHLNSEVSKVLVQEGRVVSIETRDSSGNTSSNACDYFFSTMPLRDLINIIDPQPPQEVMRVANGLVYRDFLTVGLLLQNLNVQTEKSSGLMATLSRKLNLSGDATKEKMIPDNWIYIQDGRVKVGRIQVYNNWSPHLVANNANSVWVGLEYFVDESDKLWNESDENVIDFAINEVEKINFVDRSDVLDGNVVRMKKAYPAYFGTYSELSTIYNYIDSIDNLFPVGRNGLHRYNNQDHSMMTAMLSVDLIAAGRTDRQAIYTCNIDSDYQEENPRSATAPRI